MTAGLIFIVVVLAALIRPTLFGRRMGFALIGLLGLTAAVVTKAISLDTATSTLIDLLPALATILSLMLMVGCFVAIGLMDNVQRVIIGAAKEDSRRLLSFLFWSGAIFGAFFTNDAAILLMTPLVIRLCHGREGALGDEDHMPFLFAVLYVGNLVGALVISNPINVVAASVFDISFVEYSLWMFLPAVSSMLISWWGLLFVFRKSLESSPKFAVEPGAFGRASEQPSSGFHKKIVGGLLVFVLLGFSLEDALGVSIWIVAILGATVMCLFTLIVGRDLKTITSRVDLSILIFMACIFTIAVALRDSGATENLLAVFEALVHQGTEQSIVWVSYLCAVVAACINNHSTVSVMVWLIEGLSLEVDAEKMMVLASLIGADLGPKMLPIGSLAAMMWLSMVQRSGFKVSIWRYIKIGAPVTLLSVGVSGMILAAQFAIFAGP